MKRHASQSSKVGDVPIGSHSTRVGAFALDRRQALKAATGGALFLSAVFRPTGALSRAPGKPNKTGAYVTAWVEIAADNEVTLISSQSEMGQGTSTTLAAVLADELYLPFDRIHIRFAPFEPAYRDPVYQWMFTGNSQSISSFYDVMRNMGAAAREMLLHAASVRLGANTADLICDNGVVRHRPTGTSATFGQLALEAAKLPVPANPSPRPDPAVGRSTSRWDIPSKVDGSAMFGIDVHLPGMLTAALRCAPRFGGTLAHYNAAVRRMPGVVDAIEVPNGLAIVATTFWQAHRALEKADITWSAEGATLSSGDELAPVYSGRLSSGPFFSHKSDGDVATATAAAPLKLDAEYQLPFQAHATMEPMNCTAHVAEGRCEIWAPTQGVEMAQRVAMQITGLPIDKITIHRTLIGGGFGRRLLADFLKQALLIAVAIKRPVKVIWSREEDMTHDFYRPAMLHKISGAVDQGAVSALSHRVVSPSHMLYIIPRGMFPNMKDWTEPAAPPEKIDTMAVEGLLEIPYRISNQSVEQHRLELDIPVSVWRTTGHGPNNFVLESFVDELAHAAGADPLAFRRNMLADNPRAKRVLDLAAEKANWGTPVADGRGRGLALASAFGGHTACVAELSVNDGAIKLHRIVSVVDCGRTLDPGIAESNILGGIVWGLSGMRTAMTFENGAAAFANFDAFVPLHLWETPPCEVYFIDSGEKLGGTGELSPVPVHAAVANAIFSATGKRIRALPLSISGLSIA